ncbi:MAG: hypothetical protein L6V35_09860 [Alistipes putredinis]|nr:MAG: hypothetical protein L6V35_09860 [Alistipes putredinis]
MPVCKAKDLKEMQQCLMEIDDEVLAYHASHNHLSKWMFSRGLFPIAAVLRDIRLSDYGSVSAIRKNSMGHDSRLSPASRTGRSGAVRPRHV